MLDLRVELVSQHSVKEQNFSNVVETVVDMEKSCVSKSTIKVNIFELEFSVHSKKVVFSVSSFL